MRADDFFSSTWNASAGKMAYIRTLRTTHFVRIYAIERDKDKGGKVMFYKNGLRSINSNNMKLIKIYE